MNGYDRSVKLPGYPDPYAGKPKVLFVADLHTGNQIAHDAVSHAMASMEEVARKAGIVVYLRTDTNWVSADDTYGKGDYVKGGSKGAKGRSLKDFDAVIFYSNGETEMTDQQREDLLAYIRNGKGFVGIHTAAATMYKYPAYADMSAPTSTTTPGASSPPRSRSSAPTSPACKPSSPNPPSPRSSTR